MLRHYIHGIIFIAILSAALILQSGPIEAANLRIHHNPQDYVLYKIQSHDLVMLGTRHKRQPILQFLSDLISVLHDAGVTHIGLEICSDQQGKIDHFIETGAGLADIGIHLLIDCPAQNGITDQHFLSQISIFL